MSPGCAPSLVPPAGSLLGLYCDAARSPAAWRRALLLDSRDQQLRLRLVDFAVTVTARLSDVRLLDGSFTQVSRSASLTDSRGGDCGRFWALLKARQKNVNHSLIRPTETL